MTDQSDTTKTSPVFGLFSVQIEKCMRPQAGPITASKTTDWPARRADVVAADGDEWDRLSEAFDTDWKAEYVASFVACAMERGWTAENASVWAGEIVGDALIECHPDCTPTQAACVDVIECELEIANAC